MVKHITGSDHRGWLDSHFHIPFAEYFNDDHIRCGVLNVINDDLIEPGAGFDTHQHEETEIITYVVEGELTHTIGKGSKRTLTRGHVQYMSAGTGVYHSEHNWGQEPLRLLQIWIFPDKTYYDPNYGDHRFEWDERVDKWMPVASGDVLSPAPIKIHADVNICAAEITRGGELDFAVGRDRQAYLLLIEGEARVAGLTLSAGDAAEIVEEDVTITAGDTAHVLVLEMKKEKGVTG
ncbi:hypothetical protein FACS1894202_03510 [Clostridia bacterium]|nr:hypothetical protein FACS1894202_03510 [Clostridia bacterium]